MQKLANYDKIKPIMAKKGKSKKSAKSTKKSEPYGLPTGFWAQVGAVFLIIVSFLMVLSWFGSGGSAPHFIHTNLLKFMGYTVFIMPLILIFNAVEIFRNEDNKMSGVVVLSSVLMVLWLSGLFGLVRNDAGLYSGGFVGDLVNKLILGLVNPAVAGIIYAFLIFVTVLAVLRLSPTVVFKQFVKALKTSDANRDSQNISVMRKAAETTVVSKSKEDKQLKSDFKLNAGVAVLDKEADAIKSGKRAKGGLSNLRGSVTQDKVAENRTAMLAVSDPNWEAPNQDLLEKGESPADAGDIKQNATIIKDTLHDFNIDVEMEGANIGPKVTQYTLRPPSGVKLTRITALETNIALNLAAQSLRIEAPIPGKRAVGIEVPNLKAADVRLYGMLSSTEWKRASEPLSFAVGKDITGESVVASLNKMPHLLIAGQTGSGKSVMINTLLASLLYRNSPSDMKLILVDPKQVEMAPYEDIPHLLTPIINDPEKTISALKWAVNEMERRYKLLAEEKIKEIRSYNKMIRARGKKIEVMDEAGHVQKHDDGTMPYIVIVIDELSDLMMVAARDVEALIVRLAQKARAVGIHLVLATQRPSVDVITGLIKANVPARIAFTVASQVDSRTILDQIGAEKLLGQGDMLFLTSDMSKPRRIQGAWVTDSEVNAINGHLRLQSPPQYNDEIISQPVQISTRGGIVMGGSMSDSTDETFQDAVRIVMDAKKASTSLLQRRLKIGYGRASRIIDEMEERGIVGPPNGSKPREILISSLEEVE
ncbi:DNA translocase FtsK [Candidatus Saccharibacteria bacterium]|nr:DNA translocase FtsK [Candidatus Saccharibacteria bacterium]